jgi:hypothetical protein
MEEYADIYYVDSRNAVVRDHRPGQTSSSPWPFGRRPSAPAPLPPTRTVYVPPSAQSQAFYQQPAYGQAPIYGQPTAPMIYSGPMPMQSTAATILGKLTSGQIVEMVAQIFAALQSLPGVPVATRDVGTDVGNLILYQSALASHAKRDEQVRTLGGLVARLVG